MAAVVGVAVAGVARALLLIVAEAVAAVPVVAPIVDAAVVPAVAPVVTAAVVPVVAPVVAEPKKMPPSAAPAPLVTTGVGSELIEAFTVLIGLAYAEGGMTWFDGGAATFCWVPAGLTTPRNRSR